MINHITGLPNRTSELNEDVIINGSLTINNGTQGLGLVLTSDANGLVTFKTSTGSTGTTVSCTVTGGTISAGTLTLTNCSGGTAATITGFSTGSTGNGLSAYGYAVGQSTATIGADSDVVFDLGATPFPNAGFTSVPAPAGTSFVIATTGVYSFDFFVVSTTHAAFATTPLVFAIYRNGAIATVSGNAYEFRGTFNTTDANQSVRGEGIIALTAGDVITLHNKTNTVTDTVTVAATQTGVGASPNRTLTLKKIN